MGRSLHRRPAVAAVAVIALAGILAGTGVAVSSSARRVRSRARAGSGPVRGSRAAGGRTSPSAAPPTLPRNAQLLTVGRPLPVHPIEPGFLGTSFEFDAIEPYAGSNPKAIDPVFLQLIRNLSPGQSPVVRIGGDTTDWTWWPVPQMTKPGGVRITLTKRWLAVTRALAEDLDARLILGVNLEADSRAVAAAEAHAFLTGIGRRWIEALEPGNEPELYGIFTWYVRNGRSVKGRPPGYDIEEFTRDFLRIESAIHAPIAGPTIGAPAWFSQLSTFLAAKPRLNVVTLHRYPLQLCFVAPRMENYPTIPHLFSTESSQGRADSVIPEVALAHARGLPLRIDEMNTISCGYDPKIGYSFATALWAVDALFAMARVGVDGVNIHSFPTSTCSLFQLKRARGAWRAFVEPEYYGLLMFAQAAPPGSRLLRLSGPGATAVKAWATGGPDGHIRVVLINESATRSETIAVRASTTAARPGAATLERLRAPGLLANRGVTLGGETFGAATESGRISPHATTVNPIGRDYVVSVPRASAALLTLP